jgi:GntR family transcriptional regulator / MocR family aminotransferase
MEPDGMLLELDGRGPRYTQITRALLKAIGDGILAPGARLPSTRQLARDLNCARNIVILAYEHLILEGYLVAISRRRTVVSPRLPRLTPVGTDVAGPPVVDQPEPPPVSAAGRRLVSIAKRARSVTQEIGRSRIDFAYGISEPDPRVVARLRASFSKVIRHGAIGYGDPAGDPTLREEIANRLRSGRGIVCSPSQIIVTNGTQQSLELCSRLILGCGERVAIEDPGYEAARATFGAAGARIVPIRVDGEGIDLARLARQANVRLVYVTPSHQFPTGAVLSAPRRHELLAWARRNDAFIIEDDYDGELRYEGRVLKALAGLQPAAGVIYCGTFAKSLFPAIRLGFVMVPKALVDAFVEAKWLCDRGSSLILQRLMRDLMRTGEFDRYLVRMRRRYRARRDELIQALERRLGNRVDITGHAMGLHIVAWLRHLSADQIETLVARCAERGVGIYSLARHAVRRLRRPGLMLGYGLTDGRRYKTAWISWLTRTGISCLLEGAKRLALSGRQQPGSITSDISGPSRRTSKLLACPRRARICAGNSPMARGPALAVVDLRVVRWSSSRKERAACLFHSSTRLKGFGQTRRRS